MSNAKAVNEQSFAQETGSGVSLVDFWAEWCGPCRMMGPIIDQVAAEYEGKALVAKVDVDECQNIAVKLGVNSIPTLIVFKDGAEVKRFVGVTGKADLAKAGVPFDPAIQVGVMIEIPSAIHGTGGARRNHRSTHGIKETMLAVEDCENQHFGHFNISPKVDI